MKANQFAKELCLTVEKLKADGVEKIDTSNLIAYLASASKELESEHTFDTELYKAKLQKWIEEHKNTHSYSVEMFRSVITAGQNALRTSFLMNGGSSMAMLAFIGHLATEVPEKVQLFASSLTVFVIGVLIVAIASGTTYLSQWLYASKNERLIDIGGILNVASIVLGISSYVIYGFGVYKTYGVFSTFT